MSPTLEAPARTPRKPALDRNTAKRLMKTEYQRVLDQLGSLSREQWRADTCNLGWDVRVLAAHMLGMVAMASSLREQMRQTRAAKKRGGEFIDALTAVQVDAYDGWSPEQIVAEYGRLAPKAVRFRTRMPGLMRTRPMPGPQPINPPHEYETWTFGYLVDVILTRDQWMHRTDIAAATGQEMTLTREHDGAIVDDVAHEWAQRHGRPVRLALTGTLERLQVFGPTAHASPDDQPSYSVDAVEFCRMLSGRGSGHGLLQTRVPF